MSLTILYYTLRRKLINWLKGKEWVEKHAQIERENIKAQDSKGMWA
jgi:hypothetical protein